MAAAGAPPKEFNFSDYINSSDSVVRGFALVVSFVKDPAGCTPHIKKWLNSKNTDQRRSGILCAGLSRNITHTDRLQAILWENPKEYHGQ